MMTDTSLRWPVFLVVLILAAIVSLSFVLDRSVASPLEPNPREYDIVLMRALNYLALNGQEDDGSFSPGLGPGVTAVVLAGSLQTGRVSSAKPWVAKGLRYLESFVKTNGGIYHSHHNNYTTAVALMAFNTANRDGRYSRIITNAQKYLKKNQWDEGEGLTSDETFYGGFGYGNHKRPDLSNTQFSVESLAVSGIKADDPHLKMALLFLSRSQNLYSKHNALDFAKHISEDDKGGFIYSPVGVGESKAGGSPAGGLRSYGSMTYAGLKSMLYAGVDRGDPRVTAAVSWLRKNWSVEENPGLGQMGIYYYYNTLAKALDEYGEDPFLLSDGVPRAWRTDLFKELARRQSPKGYWINPVDRWYEGDPNLVTGYVLMALSHLKSTPKR